jgi:hypothetical protein
MVCDIYSPVLSSGTLYRLWDPIEAGRVGVRYSAGRLRGKCLPASLLDLLMAQCRTHTLAWAAPQVFNTAEVAASNTGFAVSQADRVGGDLYLDQSRRLGGFPRRFTVSVSDSGLGSTVVHIDWRPTRVPWPLLSETRSAACFCRQTERVLTARHSPPAGLGKRRTRRRRSRW